jgi:predicted ATPase/DNA-binding CsgD family transcriptional regulator
MDAVKQLVLETPLVTLTGSGGVGKSRLSIQAAAELVDSFADGVWLAELGAVADSAGVATQVASVFAVKEAPGMSAADTLAAYLADQQALLVLDNCEHVLSTAAVLADTLVGACPQLRVLATSREPLKLVGEVTWRVPSLDVPGDDGPGGIGAVSRCEAVQLFGDRAGRARPGFELTAANAPAVIDICRRLDGIPLAIELAAARIRVFTPGQIAEGLDRRFGLLTSAPRTALPRQQTLQASVDWSHDLLTDLEQMMLRRLSVFAGSFDYPAAQGASGFAPIEAHHVLDLLGLLVDKSLVQVDDSGEVARYRLLETIRHYAAERLEQAGEVTLVGDRHRDYYLAFAQEAAAQLEGAKQVACLASLTADYPNLRAALAWSRDREAWEPMARLVASLAHLWYVVGPNQEGEGWQETSLEHAHGLPRRLRCQVLFGRCELAAGNFDAGTLDRRSGEGIDVARDLGDRGLLSRFMSCRNMAATLMGQHAPALDEAESLANEAGDAFALAMALQVHGIAYLMTDPPRARQYFEEASGVARATGDRFTAFAPEANLGCVLWWQGEAREAAQLSARLVVEADELGSQMTMGTALMYQAMALAEADEHDDALAAAERLAVVSRRSGMRLWETYVPCVKSHLALAAGDAETAMSDAALAAQLAFIPLTRANVLPALIEAEIAVGRRVDAVVHTTELVELSRAAGFAYYLAWGLLLQARLCRLEATADAAENIAHEALAAAVSIDAKARIVDCLELLAGIAGDLDSVEEAARLWGAAAGIRGKTGYLRCVSERDASIAAVRGALGPDSFDAFFDQGRALSVDDAVAYARRGRGERKRPSTGWASLSPAETQVTELVRLGLTNIEIGERLFCSPRTVQSHLTHIFAKLGVAGRTELAAQAAGRTLGHDEAPPS